MMGKIIDFLKKNYKKILIYLLFIISAGIILYFFPRERKFPYEYLKGSPWMHEDLISRFDFPLLKTENELNAERDSILVDFKFYFTLDENIVKTQRELFKKGFDQKWKDFVRAGMGRQPTNEIDPEQLRNLDQSGLVLYEKIKKILEFIYKKGIIEFPEDEQFVNKELQRIVIVKDKLGEEFELSEIFTSKTAYNYMLRRLDEEIPKTKTFLNSDFILRNEFNFNSYLYPNLFYDKETSNRVRESLLSNISETKGLIQNGIRIISEGDIVNQDKFLILQSFRHEYEAQLGESTSSFLVGLGHTILVVVSLIMLYLFLWTFRNEVLESIKNTGFILGFVVLMILLGVFSVKSGLFSIYLVPFTILPLIIKIFFDARVALFSYLITILLVGFLVPNGYEFVFLQFVAGMFSIFGLYKLYRRSQLVITAIFIIISYCISYFAISIIQEGNISFINWKAFAWFAGNGLLFLLSYPLIYIFEKIFGFLSDVSLMELSDANHPVLRKVAEESPGTFQHCLQVANLAEEVIRRIGGNPLLVRVGALYHDIGKLENPIYYIENQTDDVNPHGDLTYLKSTEIIISHVTRGIEIAKKHKLPKPIIDFIPTHHGTSKVLYFYKMYMKENPDGTEDPKGFNYPGPKPFSKETAVLMMSDSIEAASRSLKIITEPTLKSLVDSIIDYQVGEEQFKNSDLTFKDIEIAREVFLNKLRNIYHARIKYPK